MNIANVRELGPNLNPLAVEPMVREVPVKKELKKETKSAGLKLAGGKEATAAVVPAAEAAFGLGGLARRGRRKTRILIITPELNGSGTLVRRGGDGPRAKAGGLADVSTLLVDTLAALDVDVRVALPNYRHIFSGGVGERYSRKVYLCQDREFFYRPAPYAGQRHENVRAALAFQREVINHVLPRVRPDIIHCHDWMTGLIPAAAKAMGIPSVFTIHNVHTERTTLAEIEDRGMDSGGFWKHLFFENYPQSYEACRTHDPVDMLTSGVFASSYTNTVSPSFLREITEQAHPFIHGSFAQEVRNKVNAGCARGIVNAPDVSYDPRTDTSLVANYDTENCAAGKAANKRALQERLGLELNPDAPILFWPSRLDPIQKGCRLLTDILYETLRRHWNTGLQVAIVADGPYRHPFENIADFHGLRQRIGIHGFDEPLSRVAYAGADFVMMPSSYEPCGLPQMVGLKYGTIPIVHRTGGLQDTVRPLDVAAGTGNGIVFEIHDGNGLSWAIDQAMEFSGLSPLVREMEICRMMGDAREIFSPAATAGSYLDIYRSLL
jgi:starch synthase